MTVATIEPRAELVRLTEQLATAQQQLHEANHAHLQAISDLARGRTPVHDPDVLEAQAAGLERQVAGLEAALDAVRGELASLERAKARASREEQKAAILETLDELEEACAALDSDALNVDLWRRVIALGAGLNSRIRLCTPKGGMSIMPFPPSTASDLEMYFRLRGREVTQSLHAQWGSSVKLPSVWLKLPHMRADVERWVTNVDRW